MDLFADLRSECLEYLPYDKGGPDVVAALAAMPTQDLLIWFLNWRNRLVLARPRAVEISRELLANPLYATLRPQIDSIVREIEAGSPLHARLSTRVLKGFTVDKKSTTKNFNRREDLDLLLNDWGVHHLHVSGELIASGPSKGFVKRADELLFVIFSHTHAYLIDILSHKVWTDEHIAEVVIRNWPEAGLFYRLNGIAAPETAVSSDDRRLLRGAGVATMVQVDGELYFSRCGSLSTAGTSSVTPSRAGQMLGTVQAAIERFAADPDWLRPHFEAKGDNYPPTPEFNLIMIRNSNGYYLAVREKQTNVVIPLA